ncbi:MAG: hypothetical protein LBQ60_10900 [Bacteroidales bacterium]|nr:hypothetical protein [Bacteroidales bacterium]
MSSVTSEQSDFIPTVDTGKAILNWCNNDGKVIEFTNQPLGQCGYNTAYAKTS